VKLVSLLAALLIRTWYATLRAKHVRAEHIEQTPQYVLAFWHAHLLLMLHARYRRPISALISQSKDGEYIARVFDWYGVESSRGSSTRGGGAALRDLLRKTREGRNIAFTPDGPKGPARIAKDGVIYAAKMSGLPIVPVAFAAKKKSSSAPGTAWSCRIRSRRRCSSTASRCTCRVTRTSRSGGCASSR
jgi:lysophospholipid acyltransferase (LPLAT)-like uncharacterized protein